MATAAEQIKGALRLIGQLAQGEEPDADSYADALVALNQMLDSWSTERLSVFCLQTQVFVWPVNERVRTVGPTGNFVGLRPVLVDPSTFYYQGNLRYNLAMVNVDQYNSITLIDSTSTLPQVLYANMTMPNATLEIWPVPTSLITLHLVSVSELSQPATLATELIVPPGYLRAYRYCLAVEIATEFGIEPPPKVSRIADVAKRTIKRINNPNLQLGMPYSLVTRRKNNFNVFNGLPL